LWNRAERGEREITRSERGGNAKEAMPNFAEAERHKGSASNLSLVEPVNARHFPLLRGAFKVMATVG
jgi:hypothetical protein